MGVGGNAAEYQVFGSAESNSGQGVVMLVMGPFVRDERQQGSGRQQRVAGIEGGGDTGRPPGTRALTLGDEMAEWVGRGVAVKNWQRGGSEVAARLQRAGVGWWVSRRSPPRPGLALRSPPRTAAPNPGPQNPFGESVWAESLWPCTYPRSDLLASGNKMRERAWEFPERRLLFVGDPK